jgi:hypothetical protein
MLLVLLRFPPSRVHADIYKKAGPNFGDFVPGDPELRGDYL